MMDWTDRHCRFLHRLMSARALLYTEMVTSAALVRGRADYLLHFAPEEQPVALQLGGSDSVELAEAAAMGAERGYVEVNLNCGCPSDRVQSGAFGAVLMTDAPLVARLVVAMQAASPVPVTVKCRIGVDDQDPVVVLPDFLHRLRDAGVHRVAIHARKAWLSGLSPKENRDIPPLMPELVYRMKERFPDMHVSMNGGVGSLAEARAHLERGLDGVMVGRAVYRTPWAILGAADRDIWGDRRTGSADDVLERMRPYIAAHLASGGTLAQVTRHMLGLFHGRPGARRWRQILSDRGNAPSAGLDVLDQALAEMRVQAQPVC